MCTDTPFFVFSDVRNGKPAGNCQEIMVTALEQKSGLYAAFLLVEGFAGALGVAMAIMIFNLKKKAFSPS